MLIINIIFTENNVKILSAVNQQNILEIKNLAKELPDGIAEGVTVRAGQLIASVGESAMIEVADEPHLHFEMTVADLSVDPLEYFDDKALESLKIDASHGE